jgi:hypothetical protein
MRLFLVRVNVIRRRNMADEQEGPYKVMMVGLPGYSTPAKFAIAVQKKHDKFMVIYIPDVGTAETARKVCNLLNKEHKERGETDDAPDGADEARVRDPDQRDGYTRDGVSPL